MVNQGIALYKLAMLRKEYQRSLLLHVITYMSPKYLKSLGQNEENILFFPKTGIQTILDKSPWDSTAICIFLRHFFVPS